MLDFFLRFFSRFFGSMHPTQEEQDAVWRSRRVGGLNSHKQDGLTLIELILVLAVISIVGTVVMMGVGGYIVVKIFEVMK